VLVAFEEADDGALERVRQVGIILQGPKVSPIDPEEWRRVAGARS
jgi:hypothetical protein